MADERKAPPSTGAVECFDRPLPKQTSRRVECHRQRVELVRRHAVDPGPQRLLPAQQDAGLGPARMHGKHHVVGPANAPDHSRRQAGFHLQLDARIGRAERLQDRRQHQRSIVVHDAQSHAPSDLVLAEPLDGLVSEMENSACVADQPFTGRTEIDPGCRAGKQWKSQLLLQPLDLRADGGLRVVEAVCRPRERALIGHGQKGAQELRIEGRPAHWES